MNLIELRGNLFDLGADYALAHCISEDCKMGAGIAVQFTKQFPLMRLQLLKGIAIHKQGYPQTILYTGGKQPVFNLVTKDKYYSKPTYRTITTCINQMRDLAIKHGITQIAMPAIGCGLDRLDWCLVKQIIIDSFQGTGITITVCFL